MAMAAVSGLAGDVVTGESVQAETLTLRAAAESFFSTVKNELIQRQCGRSNVEKGQSVVVPSAFRWMSVFRPGKYNLDQEQD
ncbi:MAG: hypothetical protein AB1555_06040 [Nitrospirota bacterium]